MSEDDERFNAALETFLDSLDMQLVRRLELVLHPDGSTHVHAYDGDGAPVAETDIA